MFGLRKMHTSCPGLRLTAIPRRLAGVGTEPALTWVRPLAPTRASSILTTATWNSPPSVSPCQRGALIDFGSMAVTLPSTATSALASRKASGGGGAALPATVCAVTERTINPARPKVANNRMSLTSEKSDRGGETSAVTVLCRWLLASSHRYELLDAVLFCIVLQPLLHECLLGAEVAPHGIPAILGLKTKTIEDRERS